MGYLSLLGALPALLAMLYFDKLDAKRPEPRRTLRKVAIAGGVSFIPCVVIEIVLMHYGPQGGYGGGLFQGFVVAAMVEELAKLLCVYAFVWSRPEFDERMDGITYGVRAGLGFALVENVGYLLGQKSFGAFLVIFVLRALLAVPGHAIYGGIMGYFAAKRRFDRTGPGLVGGYLIAVFLHGAYDSAIFCSMNAHKMKDDLLGLALLTVPILIVIGGAVALKRLVKRAITADDASEVVMQVGHA